ncbi:hypothetical protein ABT010_34655 [Streptomyces sp. NPDC002668]|uniref:hypothetical protein n=1 Tax=Streptomyces sp. NPDC002668 TaxID=3154422 RepID=UPI00331F988A
MLLAGRTSRPGQGLERALYAVDTRDRAAALISAAVDCRRAGLTHPLPRQLLDSLHEIYLHQRGGQRLRPETPGQAWTWATRQRRATIALLIPTDDPAAGDSPLEVFDYLVDANQHPANAQESIPPHTLSTALAYTDASEAERLASTAHNQGLYAIGARAYGRAHQKHLTRLGAQHPKTLVSQSSYVVMLRQLGRLNEAEASARMAMEGMAAPHTRERARGTVPDRMGRRRATPVPTASPGVCAPASTATQNNRPPTKS